MEIEVLVVLEANSKTLKYALLKEHSYIIVILIPPFCGGRRIHDSELP